MGLLARNKGSAHFPETEDYISLMLTEELLHKLNEENHHYILPLHYTIFRQFHENRLFRGGINWVMVVLQSDFILYTIFHK